MKGLSAVLIDGGEIFIDNGAVHAKSRIERGITFVKHREDVPNPRQVLGLWVTLHRFDGEQGFYGAMPFWLLIDGDTQTGYKSLAKQVNGMDKAVRGEVELTGVPSEVLQQVALFLRELRPDLWEYAAPHFRAAFEGSAEESS